MEVLITRFPPSSTTSFEFCPPRKYFFTVGEPSVADIHPTTALDPIITPLLENPIAM
jgi:hypothetical protein